jgi:hypothetical protein
MCRNSVPRPDDLRPGSPLSMPAAARVAIRPPSAPGLPPRPAGPAPVNPLGGPGLRWRIPELS